MAKAPETTTPSVDRHVLTAQEHDVVPNGARIHQKARDPWHVGDNKIKRLNSTSVWTREEVTKSKTTELSDTKS